MAKKKQPPAKKQPIFLTLKVKKIGFFTSLFFLLLASTIIGIRVILNDLIYPGVYIAGVNVSLLTKSEANDKIYQQIINKLNDKKINISYQSQNFPIDLNSQIKNVDINSAVSQAFEYGHKKIYLNPVSIKLNTNFDKNLDSQIDQIAKSIDIPPIDSQLKIEDQQINVTPSQDGFVVDRIAIKNQLTNYFNNSSSLKLSLPIKKQLPNLSYDDALTIKKRLDQIKLNPIKLIFKDQFFTLDLNILVDLIDMANSQSLLVAGEVSNQPFGIKSVTIGSTKMEDTKLVLNPQKVEKYLQTIASQIDRPVEEPLFNFDGQRVTAFKPPVEGQKLDIKKATDRITQALVTHNAQEVNLPVSIVKPKNSLTNDLGIKELIGKGVSNFDHSIENRIYNIRLGATKINGVLIPPGETFSFNKTLGDISAATGFKQAYVIKSGRTVLDDGGGICQVSTTLFRAALNSGLPIVQRTAHAYRVSYYEQGFPPGIDATVFYPSVDFQFKNDTPAHILIQTSVVGTTMYINFYGTSDGRVTKISTPVVGSQSPPPPELRQDDPTLQKGIVKQVDFPAWGANVSFGRTVIKAGQQLINESFKSNYRPWQAVYLVGTKE